jgi:hypothetical protein
MGWVGGWGVVCVDLCPHVLLWCEFLVLSRKGPPDVLMVPLELCFHVRPRPVPFASSDDEGVSGGGI